MLLPDLGITAVSVLASFLLTGQINIKASRCSWPPDHLIMTK